MIAYYEVVFLATVSGFSPQVLSVTFTAQTSVVWIAM